MVIGVNIGKSCVVEVEDVMVDYVVLVMCFVFFVDYFVVNVLFLNILGLCGLQVVEMFVLLFCVVCEVVGLILFFVKIVFDFLDEEIVVIVCMVVEEGFVGIIVYNMMISCDGLFIDFVIVEVVGVGGLFGVFLKQCFFDVLWVVCDVVFEDFCVIVVGGVEMLEDVQECLDVGVIFVQGYMVFLYCGLFWGCEINRGLVRWGIGCV